MSFLIDPPWLYATGRAYGHLMPERTPAARALHTATRVEHSQIPSTKGVL